MKFIQGTTRDNFKVAIAIDKIIVIAEEKSETCGSYVQTGSDRKYLRGVYLKESYDEVMAQIAEVECNS